MGVPTIFGKFSPPYYYINYILVGWGEFPKYGRDPHLRCSFFQVDGMNHKNTQQHSVYGFLSLLLQKIEFWPNEAKNTQNFPYQVRFALSRRSYFICNCSKNVRHTLSIKGAGEKGRDPNKFLILCTPRYFNKAEGACFPGFSLFGGPFFTRGSQRRGAPLSMLLHEISLIIHECGKKKLPFFSTFFHFF